jgi:hypothetical protein
MPRAAAFGLGAVAVSMALFVLAAARLVSLPSLAILAACAILPALRLRPPAYRETAVQPLDRATRLVGIAVFVAYFALYAVFALGPEIQPDALSYHLGLAAEYLRTGGFTPRVGFYEMLPQGFDLLFLFALAFGGAAAAKLVHFAFLVLTVPLLFAVVRRLGWPDRAAAGAAALYGCAPVTGVSATAAYTDAALVFFVLSAFYLLLVRRHFAAGVAAGFCYAVKVSALVVPLAAVLRRRGALLVALGAALVIAPWMLRNTFQAGNPLAPLFNRWFPNPHFHPSTEQDLARTWRVYDGFTWTGAPLDLAWRGRAQGIYGPVWLLLPLGLLALRERRGRLLWAAAAVAAIPWLFNVGARFLMPAAALAAIAWSAALPRAALCALMAAHAVLSWPTVIPRYAPATVWRLEPWPWRDVPREERQVAGLIEGSTPPGARIFALFTIPRLYITRETLEFWHSAQAESLADSLRLAAFNQRDPLYRWEAEFRAQTVTAVRFGLPQSHSGEWCIHEVRLWSGADVVHPSPQWRHSEPEAPLAFDNNLATRWRTWRPMRAGMSFETTFDRPQRLTRAGMLSHTPVYEVPLEVWVRREAGDWSRPGPASATELPPIDLRRDATRALKNAGFDYIIAPVAEHGMQRLGQAFLADPAAWGLELTWRSGWACLFRIRE